MIFTQNFSSKQNKKLQQKNYIGLTSELLDRKDDNTPQCLLRDGRPERRPAHMANIQMKYYENKINTLIS